MSVGIANKICFKTMYQYSARHSFVHMITSLTYSQRFDVSAFLEGFNKQNLFLGRMTYF